VAANNNNLHKDTSYLLVNIPYFFNNLRNSIKPQTLNPLSVCRMGVKIIIIHISEYNGNKIFNRLLIYIVGILELKNDTDLCLKSGEKEEILQLCTAWLAKVVKFLTKIINLNIKNLSSCT
jgi:hypothetical protein